MSSINENRPEAPGSSHTILFIDNAHRDRRRERNAVLKNAGYRVHPARSFEQSLSRIGSGVYDLIIASTDVETEKALKFIDDVKRNHPRQRLLVLKGSDVQLQGDFQTTTSDPKSLLERVEAILRPADSKTELIAA